MIYSNNCYKHSMRECKTFLYSLNRITIHNIQDDRITILFLFLQASKGSLHRAAVSGQHETVSETDSVDLNDDLFDDLPGLSIQRDKVLVFSSLCKSYVMPGLSRSLYLWILFVHSG